MFKAGRLPVAHVDAVAPVNKIESKHIMAKNMIAARRSWLPALLSVAVGALSSAWAGDRIVADWRTGLAIHGFDPVAYFTDARAAPGRPEYERVLAGAIWRFRNEGNRAAFAADPDVYLPRFGGYDPVALARGVATPGNPLVWLVSGNRLYLFHRPETRAAFAADPGALLAASEAKWPGIRTTLVP
jgi:hypothetical protein